MTLPHY